MALRNKSSLAVVFLTHRWLGADQRRFSRLCHNLQESGDVILLIQDAFETQIRLQQHPPPANRIVFFEPQKLPNELGYPYPLHSQDSIVPGATHFPLLFLAKKARYERYLLIESDVEFSGDWKELITKAASSDRHFIASHIRGFHETPKWVWWRFRAPQSASAWLQNPSNLIRSFNPIYMASRKALTIIDEAHKSGWLGHYEALLATILHYNQLSIGDFFALGEFYKGKEQDPWSDPDQLSTMRWRPIISQEEFRDKMYPPKLFHPIKDGWFFDGENAVDLEIQNPGL